MAQPNIIQLSEFNVSETGVNAKGQLVFNRQNYDVSWKHYMKDYILSDDITLDITIVANK